MYYKYYNFKLDKLKNQIIIQADAECVLEKVEDDAIFEYKQPNCLSNIVQKKLSFIEYDQYHIFTLKVQFHNRLTDYKKIWTLGEFKDKGIFDGNYDLDSERIYFGIYKGILPSFNNIMVNRVTLLLPIGSEISFPEIFKVFEAHHFCMNACEELIIETLKNLQAIHKESIVIYEFPRNAKICVYGQNIEERFDSLDLPKSEIIE